MSFDNNSFYDDNSTKNWQPQPTPMEDRRRRHTGKWVTAILILGLLALAALGMTGLAVLKPASYPLLLSMAGGIVMNNASGMNCGTHANSDRMLLSARLVLADGTLLDTGDEASRRDFSRGHGADCHRDGALRLAACLRRALAALLHSGD